MTEPPPKPDENAPVPPPPSPHAFSPLSKVVWTVIGLFAAFGIFVVGLISSGGSGCKDKNGNPTSCSSSGAHGGAFFFGGGGSSTSTARGGFGSFGGFFSGGS